MSEPIFNEHVERITFHDMELYAVVRGPSDEHIWISVKPICEYLGIAVYNQTKVIRNHPTLSPRCHEIMNPSAGGPQRMFCIQLRVFFLWLAGINPSKVKPQFRDRLVLYQLECADLLYQHFALAPRGRSIMIETIPPPLIAPVDLENADVIEPTPEEITAGREPDIEPFEIPWSPLVNDLVHIQRQRMFAALLRQQNDAMRVEDLEWDIKRWDIVATLPTPVPTRALHYPEDHEFTRDGPITKCPCYKPLPPPRRHHPKQAAIDCDLHNPPMGLFHLSAHLNGEHLDRFEAGCLICRTGDS